MRTIELRNYNLIRLIFAFLILITLFSTVFPYYSKTYVFPPPPAIPLYSSTNYFWGYIELVYGGWIGLILVIASVVLLSPERKKKAFIVGSLGCALIGFNLVIRTFFQSISIQPGFYIVFIFWIALCVVNGYTFLGVEVEVILKRDKPTKGILLRIKQTIKSKPVETREEEKEEDSKTYWSKREGIINQTITFIKEKQSKLDELPFFKITSETGIKQKDLSSVVKDMIASNEINAVVRDFVIIFMKVSEEKEEELLNMKEAIEEKIAEIENIIKENRIDKAIKDLVEIIEMAEKYDYKDLVDDAKQKLNQCKELEIEKKKEEELQRIEEELKTNLSKIDGFIEKNKVQDALENLVELEEIAKEQDFKELVKSIEDKINKCKDLQLKIISKIRNTILNYSTKLARLELLDIIDKVDIQDEILIEKTIHEMIKNKEINAEYFSSSKSVAFFQEDKQQDKQGKKAVPVSKKKQVKKLRVFLSYSTLDVDYFKIADIVKSLEEYPEIKKASYWQADSKQNIVEFMENTLKNTDVFVLFCSKNSVKSNAVKDEWQAAFQLRKKGALKIVPVYYDEDDIPVLLLQLLNVKFEKDNFDGFIGNLYEEILR